MVSAVCLLLSIAVASVAAARNLDAFARCLTQKGAVLYGATWCPHCVRQENLFGDAARHLDIVDCDASAQDAAECVAAGVVGYPTWVFGDGSRRSGVVSLQGLAGRTACRLDAPARAPAASDTSVLFIDVP